MRKDFQSGPDKSSIWHLKNAERCSLKAEHGYDGSQHLLPF